VAGIIVARQNVNVENMVGSQVRKPIISLIIVYVSGN